MWFGSVLIGVLLLVQTAGGGTKRRLKEYFSPDSAMVVSVFTLYQEGNGDMESSIEFRTMKGALIGGKSFLSKDHSHGLGVMKAVWTLDSKYFVFSTIASGGRLPGIFPTFFFSRRDGKLHMLDAFQETKIVSPEFEIEYPDRVSIDVERRLHDGTTSGVATHTWRLSDLKDK
jgi:hypothetical protein